MTLQFEVLTHNTNPSVLCLPHFPSYYYQELESTFNMLTSEASTMEICTGDMQIILPSQYKQVCSTAWVPVFKKCLTSEETSKSRFLISTSLLDFTTQISRLCPENMYD